MKTRLLFVTAGVAALIAGAASAQGRPGGVSPGQSMRPSTPPSSMMQGPRATLPSGSANVGAGVSATARATRSGEAVRSEARGSRSDRAGANADAAANADANAGFATDEVEADVESDTQVRGAEARSNRRGPERANARAVERSNINAGLRTDVTGPLTERQARAVTAELNRRSLEGALNLGAEVRADARSGRQAPDRANAEGVANSDANAGLRDDSTQTSSPRRRPN